MKISSKLKLAAFVPVLMALVIGLALTGSYRVVRQAEEKDRTAQTIIRGMNEFGGLVCEYVLYHQGRPLQQFLAVHDSISVLIAGTRFFNREQQQILKTIQRDMNLMQGSFLKLVSNHDRYVLSGGDKLTEEVETRLAGRLMVWASDILSSASYLERLVDEELTAIQRKINLLIFGLIAATALFLTIVLTGITRNITRSLTTLHQGTAVIGAGNLDHRVGLTTHDEIGDFARSFDRMTEQLQEVTVSRNRLQLEVEERKKAEAAVRDQREWLRVTLNSIGDAVITADTGGLVTFLNPVASNLTGWPPEESQGRPIQNVLRTVNEHTHEPAEDIVKRVLAEGSVINMANHTALIHRDGSEIPIEDSAAPIKDAAGHILGVVIVFHDVTERRRTQEALLQSMEKLRIVADFAYGWEYWRGQDSRFLYVSPSCERITGYSREEFLNDPDLHDRIIHPEDRRLVVEHVKEARFHREPCELEFRILRRDGGERWIAHACQSVLDEKGRALGRRASNRDITERKMIEKSLERSHNELERRVRERTAELERKNRELNDFTFIASHDLQEPLRKIRTFGDLLLHKVGNTLSVQNHDYINRMRESAARMQALLKSLLDYSRLTTKESPFDQVDLRNPVDEALSNLEILIRDKRAQVEVHNLPAVEGDPHQLAQLFQNLIGNALKFQRAGQAPQVKVYAHVSEHVDPENGKVYEICVEDNGIGFDEARYAEKIFQPFQRLHGKKEFEGVGIGLAICQKIVERHGGRLTARSRPGIGSTFIVTLPEKLEKKGKS